MLLASLAADDLDALSPHLERVETRREQVLVTADAPIEHVYFLDDGIASIVSATQDGLTEIDIFGREGVSGTALLLGTDRSPHRTFIQVAGTTALRIDTGSFMRAVENRVSLRVSLLRFVQVMMVQSGDSAVANARHQIESRLARWLLMCHDRGDGDEIALTHEFMAIMIGAQRSGVTVALHMLEGAGMIRSTRGRVMIRDRAKLEDLAGDSYGHAEEEYRRLIAPFGGGPLGFQEPVERRTPELG